MTLGWVQSLAYSVWNIFFEALSLEPRAAKIPEIRIQFLVDTVTLVLLFLVISRNAS
jgi:hypothetical protein